MQILARGLATSSHSASGSMKAEPWSGRTGRRASLPRKSRLATTSPGPASARTMRRQPRRRLCSARHAKPKSRMMQLPGAFESSCLLEGIMAQEFRANGFAWRFRRWGLRRTHTVQRFGSSRARLSRTPRSSPKASPRGTAGTRSKPCMVGAWTRHRAKGSSPTCAIDWTRQIRTSSLRQSRAMYSAGTRRPWAATWIGVWTVRDSTARSLSWRLAPPLRRPRGPTGCPRRSGGRRL
mmetsp:Transcript_14366/g.37119  ORF Transcript_14366/g.37119 Transcript_14366/m.37119 type:complete len:237 (+) Transcript_14366:15-725(+)